MSPQSGLPHNNRVGDFDVFALPALMRETGRSLDQLLDDLANRSGLEGLSGYRDVRDIEKAAGEGEPRAREALDVFVGSIRHYLGAYMVALGGADAIFFTGGIGENSSLIRSEVCRGLEWAGIELDPAANGKARGRHRFTTVPARFNCGSCRPMRRSSWRGRRVTCWPAVVRPDRESGGPWRNES